MYLARTKLPPVKDELRLPTVVKEEMVQTDLKPMHKEEMVQTDI